MIPSLFLSVHPKYSTLFAISSATNEVFVFDHNVARSHNSLTTSATCSGVHRKTVFISFLVLYFCISIQSFDVCTSERLKAFLYNLAILCSCFHTAISFALSKCPYSFHFCLILAVIYDTRSHLLLLRVP